MCSYKPSAEVPVALRSQCFLTKIGISEKARNRCVLICALATVNNPGTYNDDWNAQPKMTLFLPRYLDSSNCSNASCGIEFDCTVRMARGRSSRMRICLRHCGHCPSIQLFHLLIDKLHVGPRFQTPVQLNRELRGGN